MALFRKNKYTTMVARPNIPKDIASKCKRCNTIHIKQELEKNLLVCPKCGYHFPLTAWQRISYTIDEGSFREINAGLTPVNPLDFPGYEEKLKKASQASGLAGAGHRQNPRTRGLCWRPGPGVHAGQHGFWWGKIGPDAG